MSTIIIPTLGIECQLVDAALEYARAGIPIFPCVPGGKNPATPHGFKDATTDEGQIRAWWEAMPDANLATPTGVISDVIDIDVHKGGSQAALEALTGPLEPTFTVLTPHGGEHIHYVHREGVTNAPGSLPKNIDSRGLGGYVLLPPSKLADGRGYTVADSSPVGLMPDSLFELVTRKRHAAATPSALWVEKAVTHVLADGEPRNDTGLWLAAQLRDSGLSQVDATPHMEAFQERVANVGGHPYTREEIYKTLYSAYSRPPREAAKSSQFGTILLPLAHESFNDDGNALRFALAYGHRLKHVTGWGWTAYDGQRWARGAEKEAQELARKCLRAMPQEAVGTALERDVLTHVSRSLSKWGIASTLSLASSDARMSANVDDFDKEPHLLNVKNGTLDLKTGELRPHKATDMLTQLADVEFNPDATAPRWNQFLSEIFPHDAETIAYLQRFAGYSATGEAREEKFLYASGAGSNGKGVTFRTLALVLGDYAHAISADALTKSAHDGGEKVTPALATLPKKRFVYCQEPTGDALDEGKLKTLASADKISANPKHREPITFQPTHTLWLAANKRLKVDDTSNAVWRRTIPVDFNQSFVGREDWTLEPTLWKEASGILNWIVEGAIAWYAYGLGDLPQAVVETRREYRADNDPASLFFEDILISDASSTVPLAEAMKAYVRWQANNASATWIRDGDTRGFATLARNHGRTVGKYGLRHVTSVFASALRTERTERTEVPLVFDIARNRENSGNSGSYGSYGSPSADGEREFAQAFAELEGRV